MSARKKCILIVEDEVALCDILEEELSAEGYNVLVANNGAQGLARLQDDEPDLILCDRAMPTMTGYELLERIRGVYPQYRDVPFIFMTAMTDVRDKMAVAPFHPYAYLEKPIDFSVLLQIVAQALDQSRRNALR